MEYLYKMNVDNAYRRRDHSLYMCTTVYISKRLRAIQMNELLLLLCLETCWPQGTDFPTRAVLFPFAAFASVATTIQQTFFQARGKEALVGSVHR
jgi:hypothetical protein